MKQRRRGSKVLVRKFLCGSFCVVQGTSHPTAFFSVNNNTNRYYYYILELVVIFPFCTARGKQEVTTFLCRALAWLDL